MLTCSYISMRSLVRLMRDGVGSVHSQTPQACDQSSLYNHDGGSPWKDKEVKQTGKDFPGHW